MEKDLLRKTLLKSVILALKERLQLISIKIGIEYSVLEERYLSYLITKQN